MRPQNFEIKSSEIQARFWTLKESHPERLAHRLNLSWSNWMFGLEPLEVSAQRLAAAGICFIELHGNHYGPDLGYKPGETMRILKDHGIKVSGVCGMFAAENDLSSPSGIVRQNAIDYIRRELEFGAAVGAHYLLVVPGAVGRPSPCDAMEFDRSVSALQLVAGQFGAVGIRAAIEPIRSAEVSFCHTVADAQAYINAVGHSAIQHINGDVYHMQGEESHIGSAILEAGDRLVNLHMADSNRCALGEGSLDLDTIIMALYLIGFNQPGCFVTPEPLGPGGDPYPAMHSRQDPALLDALVGKTARYFRYREGLLLRDTSEKDDR